MNAKLFIMRLLFSFFALHAGEVEKKEEKNHYYFDVKSHT